MNNEAEVITHTGSAVVLDPIESTQCELESKPDSMRVVEILAIEFDVEVSVALEWLRGMNFNAVEL